MCTHHAAHAVHAPLLCMHAHTRPPPPTPVHTPTPTPTPHSPTPARPPARASLQRYKCETYGSLVRATLGRKLTTLLVVVMILHLFGACLVYLVRQLRGWWWLCFCALVESLLFMAVVTVCLLGPCRVYLVRCGGGGGCALGRA